MADYFCPCNKDGICILSEVNEECKSNDWGACSMMENTLISSDLNKYCKGKVIKNINLNLFKNKVVFIEFEDESILELQSKDRDGETSTIYPIMYIGNDKIDLTEKSYEYRRLKDDEA